MIVRTRRRDCTFPFDVTANQKAACGDSAADSVERKRRRRGRRGGRWGRQASSSSTIMCECAFKTCVAAANYKGLFSRSDSPPRVRRVPQRPSLTHTQTLPPSPSGVRDRSLEVLRLIASEAEARRGRRQAAGQGGRRNANSLARSFSFLVHVSSFPRHDQTIDRQTPSHAASAAAGTRLYLDDALRECNFKIDT